MPHQAGHGRAHPLRLAAGVVLLAAATAAWSAGPDPAQLARGKALFQGEANPPCAICHVLHDAGATGNIGPDLDELRPERERVLAMLRDGSGVMPSFADSLDADELDALADYVVWASRQP